MICAPFVLAAAGTLAAPVPGGVTNAGPGALEPGLLDLVQGPAAALPGLLPTQVEMGALAAKGPEQLDNNTNEESPPAGRSRRSNKYKTFSVVVITHNVKESGTASHGWLPTKLLKDDAKADFVFVTFQEAKPEGDDEMTAGMAALGYEWVETVQVGHGWPSNWFDRRNTVSGLYVNMESTALRGMHITARTALVNDNRVLVGSGPKVVERIRVRIERQSDGFVLGDLQFMGTHMVSGEGQFINRWNMYAEGWTKAQEWATKTNLPTPTFMAGDMNWRMAAGEWSDRWAPQTMDYNTCNPHHHLEEWQCWAKGHGARNAFFSTPLDIQEAPLKFQPTYKRSKNDSPDCYNAAIAQPGELDGKEDWAAILRKKQDESKALLSQCFKDGDSNRTPSWTDRVLYYAFNDAEIKTRYYTDFYSSLHAKTDHRMVVWAGDVQLPEPAVDTPPFKVVEGGQFCQITNDNCITDGSGFHANNERCVIQVQRPGVLAIREFDVESHSQCIWDSVAIGGIKYCGTAGPAGVGVSVQDTITWTSDRSVTKSGWTICLE
jgi:endonuclease/exonuclease/phosphatase family metal-dependent hydrolase